MLPFYIKKEYLGRKNELDFINYLEVKRNIEWWYKNGDNGSEHFSISYYDEQENKEKLFYPDWIIKLKNNKILILDTKKGKTEEEKYTKYKAESLHEWLNNKKKEKEDFIGGIAANHSGIWKINMNKIYTTNLEEWKDLDDIFNI